MWSKCIGYDVMKLAGVKGRVAHLHQVKIGHFVNEDLLQLAEYRLAFRRVRKVARADEQVIDVLVVESAGVGEGDVTNIGRQVVTLDRIAWVADLVDEVDAG